MEALCYALNSWDMYVTLRTLDHRKKISADKKFNTVLEFCAVPSGSSILRKEYVHVTTFTEN